MPRWKKELMTAEDVQGAWAIMPTPAKEGAESWRMDDTVDLDETARAAEGLIKAGVDAIMVLGTLGEGATLTWEEKKKFISTLVDTINGRVPFFVGATSLGTRESISQMKWIRDAGADGTMLGLPMWCAMTVPGAVRFYKDVAEAVPELAICVYANPMAFRFTFPHAFWAQVAEIPQVITSKYIGLGPLLTDIELGRRKIRHLPIDFDYYGAARMVPEFCTAFWTSGAVCGPTLPITLREEVKKAKETGDWSRAKKLTDAMAQTGAPLFPEGGMDEFGKFNIVLEKERMNAAGWMKAGPCRPPYHVAPERILEGARTSGKMWAELNKKVESGQFF
jgi:trans-o-hydroxybenzylidenepyruvate hydratase-aldolase